MALTSFILTRWYLVQQRKSDDLKTPGAATAARFIDFVVSEKGQGLIRDFGREQYGEGLYNDAAYAKQYDK